MATYHNGQYLDDGTDPQPEEFEEEETDLYGEDGDLESGLHAATMHADPTYAAHVEALAKECTCSSDNRPCEGLLAGGPCHSDYHEEEEDDDTDTEDEPYCHTCGNIGIINCYCGGDLCVCENNGEIDCPHCRY